MLATLYEMRDYESLNECAEEIEKILIDAGVEEDGEDGEDGENGEELSTSQAEAEAEADEHPSTGGKRPLYASQLDLAQNKRSNSPSKGAQADDDDDDDDGRSSVSGVSQWPEGSDSEEYVDSDVEGYAMSSIAGRLENMEQKLGEYFKQYEDLQERFNAEVAKNAATNKETSPIIDMEGHEWNSPFAYAQGPTVAQRQVLTFALVEIVEDPQHQKSVARLMRFGESQARLFLDGRLTINLFGRGVANRTLWQLWAFAVKKMPIAECLPRRDLEGIFSSITYVDGGAVATRNHYWSTYFNTNPEGFVDSFYLEQKRAEKYADATHTIMPPPPPPAMRPGSAASSSFGACSPHTTSITPLLSRHSLNGAVSATTATTTPASLLSLSSASSSGVRLEASVSNTSLGSVGSIGSPAWSPSQGSPCAAKRPVPVAAVLPVASPLPVAPAVAAVAAVAPMGPPPPVKPAEKKEKKKKSTKAVEKKVPITKPNLARLRKISGKTPADSEPSSDDDNSDSDDS